MVRSVFNWRLRTPFYYGWLVLGITALATFAASGLTQVVLGGVQVYITDESGWDEGSLAYAASIGTWTSGMIAPLIGRLADRFGPRWLMPFGLLVASVAFFVIAGSNAVWQFYGGYVIGRAVSNPVLVGLVPRTAAVNFFRKRRNMALALVSLQAHCRCCQYPDNLFDCKTSGLACRVSLPRCFKSANNPTSGSFR